MSKNKTYGYPRLHVLSQQMSKKNKLRADEYLTKGNFNSKITLFKYLS